MSDLLRLFEALKPFLLGKTTTEETVAQLGDTDARRLALYRRFVQNHEQDVLEKIFPLALASTPPEQWQALQQGYFAAHPLFHYEFNANGVHFPEYLRGVAKEGELELPPWLPELADLEFADLAARLDPADIPERGPWALNPTVSMRQFAWDVGAYAAKPEGPKPLPRENMQVFFRERESEDSQWTEPEPKDLLLLKMLTEGMTVAQTAQAAGVPEGMLVEWLEEARVQGWVVGP